MNVFELAGTFAIKGVDAAKAQIKAVTTEAKTGFGETEAASDQASGKLSGALSKVGSAMGTVAKVGIGALAAGATAATAAIGGIAKSSLNAYSSYEQLTGGVETLFGASAGTVEQYADNAYKTAGMSANAYMETVTGFSASLLQSLGGDTAAAAEKGNMAVTDMSDNANKMGASIGSIQDAYQGFAKQNYTMLDNLKLGYGGTQEEMQRLLSDAEAISGVHYDLSSYADVVDAIHVVQTEMGITGTTAREASTTIEGSVNAAKASWTNWLTDLGRDDADMAQSTNELVESIITAASNIVPRMVQIMTSIASTLSTQIPAMVSQLGTVMQENGPPLMEAAKSLFLAIVQALVTVGPQILSALVDAVVQMVPQLLAMVPTLLAAGIALFVSLIQSLQTVLPMLIEQLPALVTQVAAVLIENLPLLLGAAIQLFMALVQSLSTVLPILVEQLPLLVTQVATVLLQNLPALLDAAIQLFMALVTAFLQMLPVLIGQLPQLIGMLVSTVIGYMPQLGAAAGQLFGMIVSAVPGILGALLGALGNLLSQLPGVISGFAGSLAEAAANMLKGMVQGIQNAAGEVWDAIKNVCSGALDAVKDFFGIASPSKVFRALFEWVPKGAALGIEDGSATLEKSIANMSQAALDAADVDLPVTSYPVRLSASVKARSDEKSLAGASQQARDDDALRSMLSEILALLREILEKDIDMYLDGDTLVGKTSKRMERSISKRNQLSGGIA